MARVRRLTIDPSPGMRAFGPLTVLAAACVGLLLIAVLAVPVPLLFVTYAQLIVAGVGLFDAYLMFRARLFWLGGAFVVIALLFSPFFALSMPGLLWIALHVIVLIFLAGVAFFVRGPGPEPDEDVAPSKRFL